MFKPMLAVQADLSKIKFPVLASTKLDGVRATVRDGIVYARSNKPIPNKHVQRMFRDVEHHDGELIVGSPTSPTVMRDTMSGVMSENGKPNVALFAFDHIEAMHLPFHQRQGRLLGGQPLVKILEQKPFYDLDSLLAYESHVLSQGYEGLILRDPDAPYKMGRSTVKEGWLLKLKSFVDAEFRVIGFEERMHNGNEATTNELGRTKRSSHKENKTGRGDLGALICITPEGIEFNCGSGFSDRDRAHIWNSRDVYLGKYAKVKFFPIGIKLAPRHPVFLGWRNKLDMS